MSSPPSLYRAHAEVALGHIEGRGHPPKKESYDQKNGIKGMS